MNNLLKKCTGIFTAAILTAGITPVNINAADLLNQDNTAVWDGTADISWYNDEDTAFYISSSQELAGFAQLVNEGNSFKDKTVTLKNDITLNAEDLDGWNETESTVQLWTPIGSDEENYFAGTFDGAFFSIYGLSVNKIDNVFFIACRLLNFLPNFFVHCLFSFKMKKVCNPMQSYTLKNALTPA